MESNGNFEHQDHIEVFGTVPKSSWMDEGTLRLLYLVSTAAVVTGIILFMIFLGTIAIFTSPCIKSHVVESSGEHLSLPHDRDDQGCIRDFKHPIGYEK